MDKNKEVGVSGLEMSFNADKGMGQYLKPVLKLPSGDMIEPTPFCCKWRIDRNADYEYSRCHYNILVWDLPSFTLTLKSIKDNSESTPIQFVRQSSYFYMLPGK